MQKTGKIYFILGVLFSQNVNNYQFTIIISPTNLLPFSDSSDVPIPSELSKSINLFFYQFFGKVPSFSRNLTSFKNNGNPVYLVQFEFDEGIIGKKKKIEFCEIHREPEIPCEKSSKNFSEIFYSL
jgi:hypothetical protein